MRTQLTALVFFVFAFHVTAQAYIPPVQDILKETFEARSRGPMEVTLRHRIELHPGDVQMVEEKIYSNQGRASFIWTGPVLGHAIAGVQQKRAYVLGDGKTLPSGSMVFVRNLIGASGEEMREALFSEGFLRKEQFTIFQPPGFVPEGDPQTWNLREHYIRHPDIYLHRLGQTIAFALAGYDQPDRKRIVYFDRSMRGLRRLEWKEGETNAAWTFEGIYGSSAHRMTFEYQGNPVITTDLLSSHAVNGRQGQEFLTAWRAASKDSSLSDSAAVVLKTLLSYR